MKFMVYLGALLLGASTLLAQETTVIQADPSTPDTPAITVLKLIEQGGWVMIPLGVLSIVTLMLVIVFLFTLRRGSILTPHFMNTADVLLKKRDHLGLLAIASRHSEAIARVVQRTLDFTTKNPGTEFAVVREIAETEGQTQAVALQQRVVYLADIGMLSPMLGLLGTVLGIIQSFYTLAHHAAERPRHELLAAGVSEALVATATGLVLGIISMGFYAMFRGRVQSLISDLEIASTHFLAMLGASFSKKREQVRTVDDDF